MFKKPDRRERSYLEGRDESGAASGHLEYGLLDLVDLGLAEAFDGAKFLLGDHLNTADGADPGCLELFDIGNVDAVGLEAVNVHLEVLVVLVELLMSGRDLDVAIGSHGLHFGSEMVKIGSDLIRWHFSPS